jgi:sortase B
MPQAEGNASREAQHAGGEASCPPQADMEPSQASALYERNGTSQTPVTGTEMSPTKKANVTIPKLDIDFNALRRINEDGVAWLYSPDTVIDYPIMKADDYSYYLNHLADRTWNVNGSIFIDYNCPPDLSGKLTVLYGHHMKSEEMMFGSLEEYKNQVYYQEHPFMYLYTDNENYRIDILYGFVIDAGQWRDRAFMYEVNLGDLISYAEHNTTFESVAEYAEGDRIIAMSTCSYDFNDARYVVIGILRSQ